MKRASYRAAIEWIALNDDAGSKDALIPEVVSGYVSSVLVADLFGVEDSKVGADVVRFRQKQKDEKDFGNEEKVRR